MLRASGILYQQKGGHERPWRAKKTVLPSDSGAAKKTGTKNVTRFTTEVSEGLEQKERCTEKLTYLQKHLPSSITDTLFNAKRRSNLASESTEQSKCLSIEKSINKLRYFMAAKNE